MLLTLCKLSAVLVIMQPMTSNVKQLLYGLSIKTTMSITANNDSHVEKFVSAENKSKGA